MNKQKIVIIALAGALFLVAQYIVFDKLAESKQKEMLDVYQRGYDNGLKDAVTTLYEQTQNCQKTSITLGNLTKEVFDFSCLKKNVETTPSP